MKLKKERTIMQMTLILKKIAVPIFGSAAMYFLLNNTGFCGPIGGSFESKMGNLQSSLINTIMPIMAILGLVWAGILAATGNETAKGKILLVIVGSIAAFLAPHIIGWLKGVVS
jgi:type IV secretory pathway VirB2 component (pilin)